MSGLAPLPYSHSGGEGTVIRKRTCYTRARPGKSGATIILQLFVRDRARTENRKAASKLVNLALSSSIDDHIMKSMV